MNIYNLSGVVIGCFSSEDEFQYPEEDDYDEDDDEDDNVNRVERRETVEDGYDQDVEYTQQEEEEISLEPPELFQNMSSVDAKIFLQVSFFLNFQKVNANSVSSVPATQQLPGQTDQEEYSRGFPGFLKSD